MTVSVHKRKRPFGIYAILILLGFLVVNNGLAVFRAIEGLPTQTLPDLGTSALIGLNAVLLIFYLIVGIGLWQMRHWAWYLAMIASGFGLFHSIWLYFQGSEPYLTMILLVIIVFYLNQREVKAAFEQTLPTEVTA